MAGYESIRDRDRKNYKARPAVAPMRKPRRVKTHPLRGIACRVRDAQGQYYDFMGEQNGNFLFQNGGVRPDGHLFPSRHKASSAVWHTIERMICEGVEWDGKDFFLENVT